jgi:hypothetical protein
VLLLESLFCLLSHLEGMIGVEELELDAGGSLVGYAGFGDDGRGVSGG